MSGPHDRTAVDVLTCGECGAHNDDDADFCGGCGAYLEWDAQPQPVAASVVVGAPDPHAGPDPLPDRVPDPVPDPVPDTGPQPTGLLDRVRAAVGLEEDSPSARPPSVTRESEAADGATGEAAGRGDLDPVDGSEGRAEPHLATTACGAADGPAADPAEGGREDGPAAGAVDAPHVDPAGTADAPAATPTPAAAADPAAAPAPSAEAEPAPPAGAGAAAEPAPPAGASAAAPAADSAPRADRDAAPTPATVPVAVPTSAVPSSAVPEPATAAPAGTATARAADAAAARLLLPVQGDGAGARAVGRAAPPVRDPGAGSGRGGGTSGPVRPSRTSGAASPGGAAAAGGPPPLPDPDRAPAGEEGAGPGAVRPQVQPVRPGPPDRSCRRPPDGGAARVDDRPRPGDVVCGDCGTGNVPTRRFCRRCGGSLADAPVVPPRAWWRRLLRPERTGPAAGTRTRARRRLRAPRGVVPLVLLVAVGTAGWSARGLVAPVTDPVLDRVRGTELVNPQEFRASSAARGHAAEQLRDGATNRAWAPAGAARGAWVEAQFPSPRRLVALVVHTGASTDPTAFFASGRPTRLRVALARPGRPLEVQDVDLRDEPGRQVVDVGVSGVSAVRLTVLEAQGARRGGLVALGEVEFLARR